MNADACTVSSMYSWTSTGFCVYIGERTNPPSASPQISSIDSSELSPSVQTRSPGRTPNPSSAFVRRQALSYSWA